MTAPRPRTTLRRGTCPACGRDVAIVKGSTKVRAHTIDGRHCTGTGRASSTTPRRTDT